MRTPRCSKVATTLLATFLVCSSPLHTIQAAESPASARGVRSPEEVGLPEETTPCIMGEWPPIDVKCGESKSRTRPVLQHGFNRGKACAPETEVVTGPPCIGCGDGVVQGDEECDGDARLSTLVRPANVPPPVWGLRWCDAGCKIRLPDYCGDGKVTGSEMCDWASLPGTSGYKASCTRECTLCQEADSCGRQCGDANYGQRNCCAGGPMPQDAMVKKECKFKNKSSAGRGCYEGTAYIYDYETRKDKKGKYILDSKGDVKWFPLYTTKHCALTGDEYVNGVKTGNLCDYWMEYLPDSFECRNKREVCEQVGVEERTGPVNITTVSCKAVDLAPANCDLATEWNCVEQTRWTCGSDQKVLEALWNTAEVCVPGSPACIAVTHTTQGMRREWSKTETTYKKDCSRQLVGAATGCRYAIRGGKRVELGCDTISEGTWTDEQCGEWSLSGTTQQSGKEYIPTGSTTVRYLKATEPLCARTVTKGYANHQCETKVTQEIQTYEAKVKECKIVGDLYHKGKSTGDSCTGSSASGDIGLTKALDEKFTLNNLFVKQCVQGNLEIPADRKLDRANPWSLLNIEVQNQGYSLLGKTYSLAIERIDATGIDVGKDPITQEICWTCAWIRYIGCFDPETDITMADRTLRKARDLSVGDKLWNPVTKRASKVNDILESSERQGMVLIEAGGLHVKVTQGHPVYIASKGNVVAKSVKVGDRMLDAAGNEVAITKVETLAPDSSQKVINFTLDGGESFNDHMLVANGIQSGDLFVQRQLNQGKN